MPCIAGNCGPGGLILQIALFRDAAHLQAFAAPIPPGGSPPQLRMYNALLDTGASATCISPAAVNHLGLSPIGKAQMISASHVVPANQYRFAVGFPLAVQQNPSGIMFGQFHLFDNVAGLEFQPAATAYDVLIGMDIIMRGHLSIDFQGRFCFSF